MEEEIIVAAVSRKRIIVRRYLTAVRGAASWALAAFWLMFAIALWATWVDTVRTHGAKEHLDIFLFFVSAALLLLFIFLLTGFEFAYTDLRDKDPAQVRTSIQSLLVDLQAHEDLLYETREWIGVLLIVGFAILAEFDVIYIPWFGARNWKFIFSILFTTLPLVWFAQAPAKQLAIANSENFLQKTRWIWPVLKLTGKAVNMMQLHSVTYITVERLDQEGSPQSRPEQFGVLRERPKALWLRAAPLFEIVKIDSVGAVSIEQFGTFHIVSRARTRFKRIMLFSSEVRNGSKGEIARGWHAPAPSEKLQEIEKEIEDASRLPENRVSMAAFRRRLSVTGENTEFEIECRPESTGGNRALLVEYVFSASSADKSFKILPGEQDWYEITFKFPYRLYQAAIQLDQELQCRFGTVIKSARFEGNDHPSEADRIVCKVEGEDGKTLTLSIEYPLPGAVYRVSWINW